MTETKPEDIEIELMPTVNENQKKPKDTKDKSENEDSEDSTQDFAISFRSARKIQKQNTKNLNDVLPKGAKDDDSKDEEQPEGNNEEEDKNENGKSGNKEETPEPPGTKIIDKLVENDKDQY